jgi:hypothetical protein
MKVRMLIFLWWALVYTGCAGHKEAGYLWNPQPSNTDKIRIDGMYNTLDTTLLSNGKRLSDHNTTIGFIVFKKDQSIFRDNGGNIDSLPFTCEYYKQYNRKARGQYEIKGDSVIAYLPATFIVWGMRFKTYNAWFKGYIRNRDTITGWHVVPPYPKKIGKWSLKLENNQVIFTPHTIYFIKTDAVNCLGTDSSVIKN